MKLHYTNNFDIPLSLALWLVDDGYDHSVVSDPNTYSVTELIKPLKQVVMKRKMLKMDIEIQQDLASLVSSRLGQATHDSIEKSWRNAVKNAIVNKDYRLLELVGINKFVADKILIDPAPEDITPDNIVVYMEQRNNKKIGKFTVTGQYDFNFEGQLEDFKTTKCYSWSTGLNDHHYIMQGSMYRWLDPVRITSDTTRISFLFTDWTDKNLGMPNYPAAQVQHREYQLESIFKTEMFIRSKLEQIDMYLDKPEEEIPECSEEDLWKKPDSFAYFKNPNGARATKVFDSMEEANPRLVKDGNVGKIDVRKGSVGACRFCASFPICKQKDRYLLDGSLKI
jgi:hypothetical protein